MNEKFPPPSGRHFEVTEGGGRDQLEKKTRDALIAFEEWYWNLYGNHAPTTAAEYGIRQVKEGTIDKDEDIINIKERVKEMSVREHREFIERLQSYKKQIEQIAKTDPPPHHPGLHRVK